MDGKVFQDLHRGEHNHEQDLLSDIRKVEDALVRHELADIAKGKHELKNAL